MRPLIVALVALVSMGSLPAAAQFSGGGGWYEEDEDYAPRRYRPRDFYEREYSPRYRGPGDFYERDYAPRRYRESYDQPRYGYGRQRFGRVCVTARGNCPAPPGPLNSPCGCMIPGFGPKRGAIGF